MGEVLSQLSKAPKQVWLYQDIRASFDSFSTPNEEQVSVLLKQSRPTIISQAETELLTFPANPAIPQHINIRLGSQQEITEY